MRPMMQDAGSAGGPRVLVRRGGGAARRDPAPSRLAYRMHRLWLTPLFRTLLTVGTPAYIAILTLGVFFSNAERRAVVVQAFAKLRTTVKKRPEFMVTSIVVQGASAPIKGTLMAVGPTLFPISSFHMDLAKIHTTMEAFDTVKRTNLQVVSNSMLKMRMLEQVPAIIWHSPERLELLDDEGYRVAMLRARDARRDLAMIAGEGAAEAVPEALVLLTTTAPLSMQVRKLEQIGTQHWNVVLTRGQRVMLPEAGAVEALERALALDRAKDVLERDVAALDMRNARRPTLRLSGDAMNELRRIRALERGASTR